MNYFHKQVDGRAGKLAHIIWWRVSDEVEQRLERASEQIRHHVEKLFASKGVTAQCATFVDRRDQVTLYVIEQYGEWLNTSVGEYRKDWLAHIEDNDYNIIVVRFAQADHAMLFKLTFGGSNSG